MAQFDIYANPDKAQRTAFPWCVDMQSDLLGVLPTRLVMPLTTQKYLPAKAPRRLCPLVQWDGETFFALPQMTAPFRVKDLGTAKGNVRLASNDLVAALDAVISGV
ncbi:toxin CcdB [Variovorax boronicumulans]|uniref:CcdB family protein n=1 Tax=Variovorax boronicumulans TaxID=436515 RepID=UPI0024767329|nr:CcdB family protein [Variovorax boronicumulans]MDH6166597.1 toxin CcdB [Variovorax boronicumulans]